MDSAPAREIRVALVLYGGVSLAIYENGVARSFHDLVRGRGAFGPLLELLDARAVVDVIAGTSAGGINGLLLAAALENGTDFEATAGLWRRLADLGRLLRDVDTADEARSLLRADYFLEEITGAFEELCRPKPAAPRWESEMDVFVTGTDLDGHVLSHWDSLGTEIRDKQHRTVFHLKYRPGRRFLGLPESKPGRPKDVAAQAATLAAISRITSCFPAAFPHFRLSEVPETQRQAVANALRHTADVALRGERSFIDGGVLDNKPFGPVLRAIFYRMPTGVVDRRLFFVEPDPEPLPLDRPEGPPDHWTPASVALAALINIPGHEGISEDLEQLERHNARIRWLRELVKFAAEGTPPPSGSCSSRAYARARIDALARMLVAGDEAAPSAGTPLMEPAREDLLADVRRRLQQIHEAGAAQLDHYDVYFQLRRAFFFLYAWDEELESAEAPPRLRAAMHALGRLIKALKLVRDMLHQLQGRKIAAALARNDAGPAIDAARGYLDAEAPHWQDLRGPLAAPIDLERLALEEHPILGEEALRRCASLAWKALADPPPVRTSRTILEEIEDCASRLVAAAEDDPQRFEGFAGIDEIAYPLEFTAGVHELDEVELVRVSPADATLGLGAGIPAGKKVAGDELAHFAAFLRRDWRSNDILWGRLDGICRIVESLLDTRALTRARSRALDLGRLFGAARMRPLLRHCPDAQLAELEAASRALVTLWQAPQAPAPEELRAAEQRLREAFVRAAQEDVFQEEWSAVRQDTYYQDLAWGRLTAKGVSSETDPWIIEEKARELAKMGVPAEPEKRWESFRADLPGARPVADSVPGTIVGEQATQAYLLLWGMLRGSLGNTGNRLESRARKYFRTPVLLLHGVARMLRREANLAGALAAGAAALLVGVATLSFFTFDQPSVGVAAMVGALAFVTFVSWVAPKARRLRLIAAIVVSALLAAVTMAVVMGLDRVLRDLLSRG